MSHRGPQGRLSFLVKWKNFPYKECTWEPEVNLKAARKLVDTYLKKRKRDSEEW